MIVIAEGTCMVRLLQVMLRFYHHESCGQCTPCREGMGWMHRIIDRIVAGEGRARGHRAAVPDLAPGTTATTICGMGDAAGYATVGILNKFRDEFEYFIEHKRSRCERNAGMPEIFINGQSVQAERNQTRPAGGAGARLLHSVLLLAPAAVGRRQLPHLRGPGRGAQLGRNRLQHAGRRRPARAHRLRRRARRYRKSILQFMTLNHPVDCGICDKAGECTLQDYHYQYNGEPSVSRDAKVRSTKFHPLSERIVLDNERCILCSRCVRFTREISKSNALGIVQRGDTSLVRAAEDRALDARPVFGQHRRPLPGRRAAVAPVPVQGARLVPQADRVGLPGLRARLHGADLAPQAGMEAQHARPAPEHSRSSASPRSRTRRSTARGSATRGATWRRSSSARAREQAMQKGAAGRAAGCDRGRAAPARRREASGRAGVELGLQRGARARSSGRSARAVTAFVKAGLVCRSPASGSRTSC